MTTELTILVWGCILGLVHILATSSLRTRQFGSAWNAGPRDDDPGQPSRGVGRLVRAQANFLETFPLFAAAVLVVTVADLENATTALGAWLWLVARIVYLPLYAFGVPYLRSLAWLASAAGLLMLLARPLAA